jgi:hypothetical protein
MQPVLAQISIFSANCPIMGSGFFPVDEFIKLIMVNMAKKSHKADHKKCPRNRKATKLRHKSHHKFIRKKQNN